MKSFILRKESCSKKQNQKSNRNNTQKITLQSESWRVAQIAFFAGTNKFGFGFISRVCVRRQKQIELFVNP